MFNFAKNLMIGAGIVLFSSNFLSATILPPYIETLQDFIAHQKLSPSREAVLVATNYLSALAINTNKENIDILEQQALQLSKEIEATQLAYSIRIGVLNNSPSHREPNEQYRQQLAQQIAFHKQSVEYIKSVKNTFTQNPNISLSQENNILENNSEAQGLLNLYFRKQQALADLLLLNSISCNDNMAAAQLIHRGAHVDRLVTLPFREFAHNNGLFMLLGYTPLTLAIANGNTAMVKLLLEANASVNQQNQMGTTALHIAVEHNNFEIVKLLIEYGANPLVTATYFAEENKWIPFTPLMLAQQNNSSAEIIGYLQEAEKRTQAIIKLSNAVLTPPTITSQISGLFCESINALFS
jgi:hypothetical protein